MNLKRYKQFYKKVDRDTKKCDLALEFKNREQLINIEEYNYINDLSRIYGEEVVSWIAPMHNWDRMEVAVAFLNMIRIDKEKNVHHMFLENHYTVLEYFCELNGMDVQNVIKLYNKIYKFDIIKFLNSD